MALSQHIAAFFFDGTGGGSPAVGMSPLPTLRVRRISDNTLVVTDANMPELGDGWYSFDFTSLFDEGEEYVTRAEASALTLSRDKFKFGTIDSRGFTPNIRVHS
jgi:hypothetical protein